MKTRSFIILVSLAAVLLTAFTNDVLKRLSLSEAEAKAAIRDNFIRRELWVPDKQAIKSIAVAKQAITVKELGTYMRQYIESPEFNKAYQEARAAAKPAAKGDAKILINERLVAIEQEMKEMNEKLKTAGSDNKKLYEFSLSQLKQEWDALKNPSHPMHNDYLGNLTEETEESEVQRKMETEYFNKDYPPTVKELVKLRLQHFLDVTATIDFNAKLVQQGKFKVFADPALEAKNGDWKKLFRAGPETIGAARQFAQAWLADLKK
jgi:hypothetical protein